MRRLSIYLDTSIISFLFAEDEPEKRAITAEFFDVYLAKYDVAISDIVLAELRRTTDDDLRTRLLDAVAKYSIRTIELTDAEKGEAFSLAGAYLQAGAIPITKREDALHLAIATIEEYDVLLSWNFRHLANIRKQAQVNAVNVQQGYFHRLNLLNPMEVMYEE